MKYHFLFDIFEKSGTFEIVVIGGALRIKRLKITFLEMKMLRFCYFVHKVAMDFIT